MPGYSFPVLVGDIGGTNARFALILSADGQAIDLEPIRTADFANIDVAIRDAILPKCPVVPKTAILAIAGPISGDEIELTNCPWVVRPKVMMPMLGLTEIVVINDFEAQALAVASLGAEHLEQIGGSAPEAGAARVVLGPGTGLGVAGLINISGIWYPVKAGTWTWGRVRPGTTRYFRTLRPSAGGFRASRSCAGAGWSTSIARSARRMASIRH